MAEHSEMRKAVLKQVAEDKKLGRVPKLRLPKPTHPAPKTKQ